MFDRFDRLSDKVTDGNVWVLFQTTRLCVAALQGLFCLPLSWNLWVWVTLRYGVLLLDGRNWMLLLKYINKAKVGVKVLATLQLLAVAGVAYYASFLTPMNLTHPVGSFLVNGFAAIAAFGIVRDAWKMQDDIDGSGMMRAFRLIK